MLRLLIHESERLPTNPQPPRRIWFGVQLAAARLPHNQESGRSATRGTARSWDVRSEPCVLLVSEKLLINLPAALRRAELPRVIDVGHSLSDE